MTRPGFSGRMPIAAGDEETDVVAFRAAMALAVESGAGDVVATYCLPARQTVRARPVAVTR